MHSPKYSNRRVTSKTAQQTRVESPSTQSEITLHTVYLGPVTVQQDLRQSVDSLARVNHPAYSSTRACGSSATRLRYP